MLKPALCAAFLAVMGVPAVAIAQTPPPVAAGAYRLTGFRSAQWGMTPDQVRAAITRDFPKAEAPGQASNPAEGSTALIIKLPGMDPAPGPVAISYIFGARSKTLSHINIQWALDGSPTPAQRQAMASAGVQMVTYFKGLSWPAANITGGRAISKDTVLLFGGIDAAGGGAEVLLSGAAFQVEGEALKAPPTGPIQLQVSYDANLLHPDIFKVAPGSF